MRRLLLAAVLAVVVAPVTAAHACVPQVDPDLDNLGKPEFRPAVQEPHHC